MEEEWTCSICLDGDPQDCHHLVPCNHRFHTDCIMEHTRRNGPTCPYCRGEVDEDHLPQQPVVHPDYEPVIEQEVILDNNNINNINIVNDADMFLQLVNFLNQLDNNDLSQIVNNLNENINNNQVENVLNNLNHINNNYNFIVNNLFIQN